MRAHPQQTTPNPACPAPVDVKNTGGAALAGVEVADDLSALGSVQSVEPSDACSISGSSVSCSWASLAAGAQRTVTIQATTAASTGRYENVALVEASGQADVEAKAAFSVQTLIATQTVSPSPTAPGTDVTFTLEVGRGCRRCRR